MEVREYPRIRSQLRGAEVFKPFLVCKLVALKRAMYRLSPMGGARAD